MTQTSQTNLYPHVAIVVLNWNGKNDTLECLDSLSSLVYPNHSIIVVDNGSTDGSVDAISQAHPNLTLIQNNANLGYAGGNNVGIRYALGHDAEYVLLLNNDTLVDSHLLDEFVKAAAEYPDFGALSGKIYQLQPPDMIWYAGAKWMNREGVFHHIAEGRRDTPEENNKVTTTDYASGCAFFVSAKTFRKVGLLDENMFLMYEESDWCYRARKSGFDSYFIPTAKLWHKVSVSMGGRKSPLSVYFMTRNRLLWAKRHLSFIDRLSAWKATFREYRNEDYVAFSIAGNGLRARYWALRAYIRRLQANNNRPRNIARRIAIKDFLAGRAGDCPPLIRQLNSIPDDR